MRRKHQKIRIRGIFHKQIYIVKHEILLTTVEQGSERGLNL